MEFEGMEKWKGKIAGKSKILKFPDIPRIFQNFPKKTFQDFPKFIKKFHTFSKNFPGVPKKKVVTGASVGIGLALCQDLVQAGMIVCGMSKRKDKMEVGGALFLESFLYFIK